MQKVNLYWEMGCANLEGFIHGNLWTDLTGFKAPDTYVASNPLGWLGFINNALS